MFREWASDHADDFKTNRRYATMIRNAGHSSEKHYRARQKGGKPSIRGLSSTLGKAVLIAGAKSVTFTCGHTGLGEALLGAGR
jgi:hypothetical protein